MVLLRYIAGVVLSVVLQGGWCTDSWYDFRLCLDLGSSPATAASSSLGSDVALNRRPHAI